MTVFIILAAALTVLALVLLVPPLLRNAASGDQRADQIRRRVAQVDADLKAGMISEESAAALRKDLSAALVDTVSVESEQPEQPRKLGLAVMLILAIPVSAVWIYLEIGLPEAIDLEFSANPRTAAAAGPHTEPDDAGAAPSLDQAVAGLQARLRQQPDDVEGWVLLGRSYLQLGRNQDAVDAFESARALAPEEPWVLVDLVEARFLASGEAQIDDAGIALLQQALQLDPTHQKGTWMLGIAAYQRGEFEAAVAIFENLQSMLEPGSPVAQTIAEQIADARQRAGMPQVAQAPSASAGAPAATAAAPATPEGQNEGPRLQVAIELDPDLAGQISGNEILFVFARAANGPAMPLAVQRLSVAALPTTVVLDNSMAMAPQFTLDSFDQVVVGARISRSGNAAPQPGDLQGLSDPLPNSFADPIRLVINTSIE